MYKEFGIYTGEKYTCVITQITPLKIIGFSFPNTQFKELKNDTINTILYFDYNLCHCDKFIRHLNA